MRVLAVTMARRSQFNPEWPTLQEAGAIVEAKEEVTPSQWVKRGVPIRVEAGPRDVVAKMQSEIVKAINNPATQGKLTTLGVEQMIMAPDAFDIRIAKEADMAVKLAKAAKIDPQ